MKIFRSLPIQLILSILAAFVVGRSVDLEVVRLFYTASNCFIDLLLFILPFMVFSLIYLATTPTQQKSVFLLLFIFLGVFLSNFTALTVAYLFSSWTLPLVGVSAQFSSFATTSAPVTSLIDWHLPALISTDKAMLMAVILGTCRNYLSFKAKLDQTVTRLSNAINFLLNRLFIPMLPLYVFGFCVKLSYEEALPQLFSSYGKVFLLSMLLVAGYLLLLYFCGSGGNWRKTLRALRTMLPAGLTGFSTMSSAATMPVTIACTEKNTNDPDLTRLVIPSTSNIHMLGDDLTIVMTAMTLLTMFGYPMPDVATFAAFASAFCVAKLSCVGVPGASVLVVLPVLQTSLGFSPEMITVLTTIYILQDSFGTAANVLGNGAFTLIVQRLVKFRQTITNK